MAQIKFGTDGWRAVIAEDFTFANVARVAQATVDYWANHPITGTQKKVVIGYDRRFLSDQFARRTAEVFLGNGFEVILTDRPTPTPSVSYAVKAHKAIGGVKVTTANGWFAARPSGTEAIYKLYAESFRDSAHLNSLVAEARNTVAQALSGT